MASPSKGLSGRTQAHHFGGGDSFAAPTLAQTAGTAVVMGLGCRQQMEITIDAGSIHQLCVPIYCNE